MALNKAKRELQVCLGTVAANGTISGGFGLSNGASGTGSCTLSDTSLYTFVWPKAFNVAPAVSIAHASAVRHEIATTTTGCTVRLYAYDSTTKTASIFTIQAMGYGDAR
jgi:hypothetical protein